MIKKLFQNLSEKAGIEFWLSNQRTNLQNSLVFLTVLFLPTQLGLHFWPDFAFVRGARIDYLSPTFYFTDALVIFLLLSFANKKNFISLKKLTLNYLHDGKVVVLLGVIVIGIFLSRNPHIGILTMFRIIEFGFLTLTLAKNIQKNKLRFILPALAIGIIFESVLAIVQFQNQGSLNGFFYFIGERAYSSSTPNIANASIGGELILRPYATFPHPNVLAGYLVIGLYIVMSSLSKKIKENWFYYLVVFTGTVALVLTLSRAAIVIWLMLLGLLFLRKKKLIVSAFLGLTLMFIFFPEALARFREASLTDQAFIDRVLLVKASVRMTLDNPFFGVGLGNFLNNLPQHSKLGTSVVLIQPVHNIILLLVSQIGLIGTSLVSYYFVLLFRKTEELGKHLLLIFLGLGMLDHYFFTLQQGQLLLCLILGIGVAGVVRFKYGTHSNS